ncbi:MAG: ROK family protein [Rhodospirillales bacterium]|nr:ROK family protein [Rhodospirillales bacterium]
MAFRIGIDLGGTKIEGIALGPSGEELSRRRAPTPAGDYAATLHAIAGMVRALEQDAGAESATVGVGIPGAVSPVTGLVKNANSTCLIGRALDRDLAAATGRPVRLANDANCFVVSETADGAAKGARVAFGVILGTGVGGGIALDGRAWAGANAIAGEWGHNPLPWPEPDELPGEPCYCGKRGCIETFLSGPALARDHAARAGVQLDPEDVATRAETGDPHAQAALGRYEERLARALATVVNLLDPDAIVLGGGLSAIARLYDNVPPLWQRWVFSDRADTPLRRSRHGPASGVRGAAWLWPI